MEMPYSDLSNFLQVDRSTLMKELAKMESEELPRYFSRGLLISLLQIHAPFDQTSALHKFRHRQSL